MNIENSIILSALSVFLFFVVAMICLVYWVSSLPSKPTEDECVYFYEEHGYILDSCNKYADKLEQLDIEKERP